MSTILIIVLANLALLTWEVRRTWDDPPSDKIWFCRVRKMGKTAQERNWVFFSFTEDEARWIRGEEFYVLPRVGKTYYEQTEEARR